MAERPSDENRHTGIEHLSPSTVQSYRNCGRQVYFNKMLGIKNPVSYAMTAYGTAMHKAIELLYKNKLSKKDFCKTFSEEWNKVCVDVNNWKNDTSLSLLEQGMIACEDFYDHIYGKYKVKDVEQELNIDRGKGLFPILCYADAITEDGEIIDYKFGRGLSGMADSKSYTCNMATYAWGYEEKYGKRPKKIIFIKEKWKRHYDKQTKTYSYTHDSFVIDEQDVTDNLVDFYKKVYDGVETGIQAGVWLPAPDDSFFCKSCGYRIMGVCKREVF